MKLIVSALFFVLPVFGLMAQNSTSSPYSGFGIGELEAASGGRNAAMGETGIALRSNLFLNSANPASLTAIDPQCFVFDMGFNFKRTELENTSKKAYVNDGNLSWVQMAFPISKTIFGGFSVNPKSSVGYNIFSAKSIGGTSTYYPAIIEGTGGLSEAALLLAWKPFKNISIGGKGGYIWGNVTQTLSQSISVSSTVYQIDQEDNSHYSGGYFNAGTQIIVPLNANSSLVLGGIAGVSSNLTGKTSTTITKTYNSASETISSDVKSTKSMKLPVDIGFGISYMYTNKWVATFDIKQCNWKDATINFNTNKLSTNTSFRSGIEYSPKYDKQILRQSTKYRIGYRYETGYLKLYNNQIHEQAVSLGIGLPIRKDRSYANFSVELGTRGTKAAHLVKENYVQFNCSFNLWDRWFFKRQFE